MSKLRLSFVDNDNGCVNVYVEQIDDCTGGYKYYQLMPNSTCQEFVPGSLRPTPTATLSREACKKLIKEIKISTGEVQDNI